MPAARQSADVTGLAARYVQSAAAAIVSVATVYDNPALTPASGATPVALRAVGHAPGSTWITLALPTNAVSGTPTFFSTATVALIHVAPASSAVSVQTLFVSGFAGISVAASSVAMPPADVMGQSDVTATVTRTLTMYNAPLALMAVLEYTDGSSDVYAVSELPGAQVTSLNTSVVQVASNIVTAAGSGEGRYVQVQLTGQACHPGVVVAPVGHLYYSNNNYYYESFDHHYYHHHHHHHHHSNYNYYYHSYYYYYYYYNYSTTTTTNHHNNHHYHYHNNNNNNNNNNNQPGHSSTTITTNYYHDYHD